MSTEFEFENWNFLHLYRMCIFENILRKIEVDTENSSKPQILIFELNAIGS